MTAAGVVCLLFGFGVLFAEAAGAYVNDKLGAVAAGSVLAGAALVALGVVVKLWQVMP